MTKETSRALSTAGGSEIFRHPTQLPEDPQADLFLRRLFVRHSSFMHMYDPKGCTQPMMKSAEVLRSHLPLPLPLPSPPRPFRVEQYDGLLRFSEEALSPALHAPAIRTRSLYK